jgi:sec-independent protein translocase protein TatC
VRFFVNFNSGEFNVLVQASQFYGFAATVLLAMGIVFQVPVVILGATRLGFVTPQQLRKYRRYAVVACAAVAAFLPGDVITLVLETVPLYRLYEVSILVASLVGRADVGLRDAGGASLQARDPADDPAPEPEPPADPTVQDMIDHVDPRLSD